MGTKLFVGGLPWAADEHTLQESFQSFGEVVDVKIVRDRETNRSRGFGFVTFSSAEAAATAVESVNNSLIGGRQVTVREAEERGRGGPPRGGRSRDGFDSRPPRGDFERPPRGGFERPPRGDFERPPRGDFERPPRGDFERPPRRDFERPPSVDGPPRGGFGEDPFEGENERPAPRRFNRKATPPADNNRKKKRKNRRRHQVEDDGWGSGSSWDDGDY